MPRFAANLSMLFADAPLPGRFERAARAGFHHVEMQFPYEQPAEVLRQHMRGARLAMVLHNLPAGDFAAGERGIACHPGREAEFREGVALGIAYARILEVPQLNCLAGIVPPGVAPAVARATLLANLRHAAEAFERAGLKLLLEVLNRHDAPGFVLEGTDHAAGVLEELAAPNAYLQYDVYHAQRGEGDLCRTLERHLARIAHVQVADNPGRHEPGSGEIRFEHVFAHLDRIGYRGFVGCEYHPAGRTEAGLAWLEQARRHLRATV